MVTPYGSARLHRRARRRTTAGPPYGPGASPGRERYPLDVTISRALLALMLSATIIGLAGCTTAFDPTGPCTANGRAAGAYPDMEQLLPTSFRGFAPDQLDSGRNCTQEALGTLWDKGVRELRFAGGLWKTGAESGVTLALLRAPDLKSAEVGTFYEMGARTGSKTEDITTSAPVIDGSMAHRIDLTNGDYLQSVVVLPDDRTGDIRVVLVSSAARDIPSKTAHEAIVDAAIQTYRATAPE